MFPICLQLAAGKTWQSLIYTVYTYGLICIYIYTHIIQLQLSSLSCCRYIYIYIYYTYHFFQCLQKIMCTHTCHSIGVGSMTSILGEYLSVETGGDGDGFEEPTTAEGSRISMFFGRSDWWRC